MIVLVTPPVTEDPPSVFAIVNLFALFLVTDIPDPAAISTSSFVLLLPDNLILVVPDTTDKS